MAWDTMAQSARSAICGSCSTSTGREHGTQEVVLEIYVSAVPWVVPCVLEHCRRSEMNDNTGVGFPHYHPAKKKKKASRRSPSRSEDLPLVSYLFIGYHITRDTAK